MNIKYLLIFIAIIISSTSCVSTKRTTYLQENEEEIDGLVNLTRIQKPYRLQVDDLLSIRVKALDQEVVGIFNPVGEENSNVTGEEQMYYDGFLVDDHGNIRVPILGEINVLGYTLQEVRKKIEKELMDKYFREEANIFVTVKLAGIRYTTIGEIGTGSQVIYKERVTIMEAIANAGDVSEYGDKTNVVIMRKYPEGIKKHHIDLTKMDAMESDFYYIQPNDLIIVNPLPQKALGLGTTGLDAFRTITAVSSFLLSIILLITR